MEKHVVASRLGTRLPRNCVFLKIPIVSAFKNLPQEPAAFSLQRGENDAVVVLAIGEKSKALHFNF